MTSYISSVIAVAAIVALGGFISYDGGTSRIAKAAMAMILLYTVSAPVLSMAGELGDLSVDGFFSEFEPETDESDPLYYERTREAFSEGVRKYVAEEFSLEESEISVSVFDFDFEHMRAEKIKIILSGRSALADTRSIAEAVTAAGLGKCEVELEFS